MTSCCAGDVATPTMDTTTLESTHSKQSGDKGIVALTMWLQTFPSFGPKICEDEKTANAQELFEIIGSSKLTR